jgi:hypothetical protein
MMELLLFRFDSMYRINNREFFLVEEFYTIKFADLIGAINCSINVTVAVLLFSRATSAGVFPYISLALGSAPASMRALMILSGAPSSAASCNAFVLYWYSVDFLEC